MRTWVIGNSPECDIVVDSPLASSRHCQLTQTSDGFVLDDVGSTNGTYLDGVRIGGSTRVKVSDTITLGRTVPMPWPADVVRYFRIGRVAGNDIVLDDSRVSSRHARLIVVDGDDSLIEDLGSSNGTFLNTPERRVTAAVPLLKTDTVYFGTFAVPAALLLAECELPEPAAPSQVPVVAPVETSVEPTTTITPIMANLWSIVLLTKAVALAVLVVLILGKGAVASTTFALALLAIWLGCSVAAVEAAAGRSWRLPPGVDLTGQLLPLGQRLLTLLAMCAGLSAVVLAIVYFGSGLRGSWPMMWAILVLASAVGLLFGLIVTALNRHWLTTPVVLLLCFVPLIALGGCIWPLPALSSPLKWAAAAMPSRWAFEGLLVQVSDVTPTARALSDQADDGSIDLAEPYFPADTDRMGARADAMALAFMVIGLTAATAFISVNLKRSP